ncbi:MFS transporter [Kribbella sandramycini]|uniref:EmrB/QacA subfamily drug resistance transporter n=1 Tax=Kribbella sandramycini TaxID=60450 RepID=A0A7Y4P172_9ACTN|nr:MFS transporter [Kribbella sandramycini]MBB6564967.1 EmrB/QacA subfamily drug resistance transporter [Kribbella sandramycini]NOL42663.1 MFS transporter [Kribbella sandramycini]
MTTTSAGGTGSVATLTPRQTVQAMSGLMMGLFVAILAGTVVSTALPRIISDLQASQSSYTWVVTVELLAMTATVPLWGKLADLYNNKLLVQLSLGFFVVGSLVAGFAPNIEVLLGSRVLQGLGGGGLTALVQIVMAAIIPPRELGRYSGIFGAVFASATVGGPLLGGFLVDSPLGWRACFLIGVPFVLVAIFLLQRTLHLPTVRRDVRIDWWGAFFITAGVSTLLVWVSLAGKNYEWVSGWSFVLVLVGLLSLLAAVLIERRHPEPIIPMDLFRNRTVTLAIVASTLVGVAMFGGSVFLAQYFQIAQGYSPTAAGLMGLPMIIGMMGASTVAGALITKYGKWKIYLVVGSILLPIGLALFGTIEAHTSKYMLWSFMLVLGIGIGLVMQNLVLAAQNDVPARELGAATSAVSFFRSMGGTIGVSVLGAILANRVIEELGGSGGGGGGAVPNLAELPPAARVAVENAYGVATAELFMLSVPVAVLALIAVVFIKEKPLLTTTATERLATEETDKLDT